MQLVRDEWQVAVSKIGHLEVGESVVFTHGPGTVEALQPDGGITVKASFRKSFTFESDGKVNPCFIHLHPDQQITSSLAFDHERRPGDLTADIEIHISPKTLISKRRGKFSRSTGAQISERSLCRCGSGLISLIGI